ncbi:DUF2254 domain-containing protein [Streptomyces morookaense]|uniref:DUF2254 domain-containing protein n=1 Tax=Streptomyces morookaense TaxID=1970 RepID=UPI00340FBFFA
MRQAYLESHWRREVLRTNLWLVPVVEVVLASGVFLGTCAVDRSAYRGLLVLPWWVIDGSADAARQVLAVIAGSLITVVGVVFSVVIVTLTLASTQFGPRMLRTFIRDRTTQLTLGTFVATFVYAVLTLVAVSPGPQGDFVPHLSITVCMVLVLADLTLLIYFIHHTATSIQLPHVIAGIAAELSEAIEAGEAGPGKAGGAERGPCAVELHARLDESGGAVPAPGSGYLQFVRHRTLVRIAAGLDAVIRLDHCPGQFLLRGRRLATVWPASAAPEVASSLARVHITGPSRTLAQDIAFAVDQLVEIALRALSPAVNDTFTALTCIDWLGDGLCRAAAQWQPNPEHRDEAGYIRVLTTPVGYQQLVERAFEKIRQAGRGMPAVLIRQLDALAGIMTETPAPGQRQVLLAQAQMIQRASAESVPEQADHEQVHSRYLAVLEVHARLAGAS